MSGSIVPRYSHALANIYLVSSRVSLNNAQSCLLLLLLLLDYI